MQKSNNPIETLGSDPELSEQLKRILNMVEEKLNDSPRKRGLYEDEFGDDSRPFLGGEEPDLRFCRREFLNLPYKESRASVHAIVDDREYRVTINACHDFISLHGSTTNLKSLENARYKVKTLAKVLNELEVFFEVEIKNQSTNSPINKSTKP